MAAQPHDRVLTHVVDSSGKASGRKELDDALAEGYRVIEVLCTPSALEFGGVFVTVVLTHDEHESAYSS
jgi:hypothetical protein